MYVFAEPVTEEQVQEIQSRNKSKIEEFERNILGLNKDEMTLVSKPLEESESVDENASRWEDIQAKVEEAMNYDEVSGAEGTSKDQVKTTPVDGASNDGGAGGTVRPVDFFDSGSPSVQTSGRERSDNLAASAAGEVEEEEDDDEEEEEEEEDEEEDDDDSSEEEDEDTDEEDEDEEEDDDTDDKDASAVTEDDKEVNVMGFARENELIGEETDGTSGAVTNEEATSRATLAVKGIGDVPNSEVEDEVVDELPAEIVEDVQEEQLTADASGKQAASGSLPHENLQVFPPNEVAETADQLSAQVNPQADASTNDQATASTQDQDHSPILAMTLTTRNKVNGSYVTRPTKLTESDQWSVEYSLAEIESPSKAWNLYGACQNRRKKKLDDDEQKEEDVAKNYYLRKIRDLSEKGREWRDAQDRIEGLREKVVLHGEGKDNAREGRMSERSEDE